MQEINFYSLNKQYKEHLRILSEASDKKTIKSYYDIMSNFISEFDVTLKHVGDEQIHIYFDFSDLLENILLACERHDFKLNHFNILIVALRNIYENDISEMIMPANQHKNIDRVKILELKEKIAHVGDMAKAWKIYPTIRDYDAAIKRDLDLLDDHERGRLMKILRIRD